MYGKLMENLALGDTAKKQLSDLLVERRLKIDLAIDAYPGPNGANVSLRPNYNKEGMAQARFATIDLLTPEQVKDLSAANDVASTEAKIRDLLGEMDYNAFKYYDQTLPLRMAVMNPIREALANASSSDGMERSLSPQQSSELLDLLYQANPEADLRRNSVTSEVVDAAAKILSEKQMDVLTKYSRQSADDAASIRKALEIYLSENP